MKAVLKNVRLGFPQLFEAQSFNEGNPAFGATFIFGPDHEAYTAMKEVIREVAKEKWGAKAEEILKSLGAQDKLCLHNGDSKAEYEGFPGNYFVSARNEVRPVVVDRNRAPLTAADGKPYAGCYVVAILEVWAQDNKYGKRINASLSGVQFFADGDAFSGGGVAKADDFEDLAVGEENAGDFI